MNAATTRQFLFSNVSWPLDQFFVPSGGFKVFLHENLRFKVFLVMTAVFPDAYMMHTIKSFAPGQREPMCRRVKDIMEHMLFAMQIRQNEFCHSYGTITMPAEAVWMFHVILVLIHVVGFNRDERLVRQHSFLNDALSSYIEDMRIGVTAVLDYKEYDHAGRISHFFICCVRPTRILTIPTIKENLDEFVMAEVINEWRWEDDMPLSTPPGVNVPSEEVLAAEMAGLAACKSEEPVPKAESLLRPKISLICRSRHLLTAPRVAYDSGRNSAHAQSNGSKLSSSSSTVLIFTTVVDCSGCATNIKFEALESVPSSCESMPELRTMSNSSVDDSD
ncbi:hypothetical protein DFH09DRAFT_1299440 [Mycena vulgaris]|nr:hypothetical protein DFH09DRAFT_1299440 [Mycena vulgaris]